MSVPGSLPPDRVPTLTEVVAWPETGGTASLPVVPAEAELVGADFVVPAPPAAPMPTEEQIIQHVLADVQRQVELMLEYRLREALSPLLTRAADALVREARSELASTLRDVVARAVAQELARHRAP